MRTIIAVFALLSVLVLLAGCAPRAEETTEQVTPTEEVPATEEVTGEEVSDVALDPFADDEELGDVV